LNGLVSATRNDVTFPAPGGITLAGHLYVPAGEIPHPALVFTGPFTGVKEQVTGRYAAELAECGFVTLAFDHRNFGASSGNPRQHEDAAGKGRDLLAATMFLSTHPSVHSNRLGVVGVCLGGSYAVRHAAFDPRIGAVALVAGGYNDPSSFQAGMGGEQYGSTLAGLLDVMSRDLATGDPDYLAAVDGSGGEAAMAGDEPFAYYGTERSASPGWANRVTRSSIYELLTLDAVGPAPLVSPRPTLMIHGRVDAYCTPEGAVHLYERLGEPKQLVWMDTSNHIDLYDNPQFVGPAIDQLADWFALHLDG
jgi:fermentation-respiration switch protein FrsA (DUF1100 family)